ncbi:hypothetical protein FHX34_103616 [Actinoplanes teichomyceticus]|uniref:CARDB domain-containing protein n=1 Tax=Actinoplanes teichomyceticus TaxID=1867 RepID=A0A561WB42_ACTTI|nr:hypothetical protein FHX34_103616 [Actinoplanes teichomyceticus]
MPRRHLALICLAVLVALAAAGGLVHLRSRPDRDPDPAAAAARAAAGLRGQDLASIRVSFLDPAGLDVTGDLTVARGGAASGTLADAGGGRAEFYASGDETSVRGDEAWWARRDAARVRALADHWVRTQRYAFPIHGSALRPAALADLIDWVRDDATTAGDADTVAGEPVVGLRRNDWTVLFSRARPHRLVWFGGPLRDGAPITSVPAGSPPSPAYVSALVAPAPGSPPVPRPPAGAVAQAEVAVRRPEFDVTVNAATCRTVTCTWSVTVRNTGTAPGEASVIASVSPGMPRTRVVSLGTLAPGATATTAKLSFANPAPTGRNVSADYRAQVFCPQRHGPNLTRMRRLQEAGILPERSGTLRALDPAPAATALLALDGMRKVPRLDPDRAVQAVEAAVRLGALPEVGDLVRAGRLENPEILYAELPGLTFEHGTAAATPANDRTGRRRRLQIAAAMLREDPAARVTIDAAGPGYRADLLVRSGSRTSAVQVRPVRGDAVSADLTEALTALRAGAPAGSTRVVVLHLDASAGFAHAAGREHFARLVKPVWCDGRARADEIVVMNQAGVQRWTGKDFADCG